MAARVISAGYNYGMNCRFVFRRKPTLRTAADYLALAAVILWMNSLLLQLFATVFHVPLYLAKALTEVSLFLFSWLVQRLFIFRTKRELPGRGRRERA